MVLDGLMKNNNSDKKIYYRCVHSYNYKHLMIVGSL